MYMTLVVPDMSQYTGLIEVDLVAADMAE